MQTPEKYKQMLGERIAEVNDGHHVYNQTQVKDMLLDLWLALNEDFPESVPADPAPVVEPVDEAMPEEPATV